jgi:hypothetical protein
MCPKLTRLAELVLTIPVSNAWSEKGASKVKIIKTDLRNCLKNDKLKITAIDSLPQHAN